MKLVYFAWLRERLGLNEEEIELPENVKTVDQLLKWQKLRDEPFASTFEHCEVIQVALDQQHVQERSAPIEGAREIAMFPPMTGG